MMYNPIKIFSSKFCIGDRVTWPALGDTYPAGSGEVLSIYEGRLGFLWCKIKTDDDLVYRDQKFLTLT